MVGDRPSGFDDIEDITAEVGRIIGGAIPKGYGFALLVFTMGSGGGMTYVSNAMRTDMIEALLECAAKLNAEIDTPPHQPFETEH